MNLGGVRECTERLPVQHKDGTVIPRPQPGAQCKANSEPLCHVSLFYFDRKPITPIVPSNPYSINLTIYGQQPTPNSCNYCKYNLTDRGPPQQYFKFLFHNF